MILRKDGVFSSLSCQDSYSSDVLPSFCKSLISAVQKQKLMKHFSLSLLFTYFSICDWWKHSFSGLSGTIVLHFMFFSPFPSAQLTVVNQGRDRKMWVEVIRLGGEQGKHEDSLDNGNM